MRFINIRTIDGIDCIVDTVKMEGDDPVSPNDPGIVMLDKIKSGELRAICDDMNRRNKR